MQVTVFPASQMTSSVVFTTASTGSDQAASNFVGDLLELPVSIRSFADTDGNVRLAFMQYSEALSTLLSPPTPNTTFTNSGL